ncbi:hypothetical protein [Flavobacterium agrisoli]|uniref:Uncharacterized protein n=1 Tax=Flavobacterium agrisoli TaxID=2793066 RepID=A0A934UJQ5_9FLAO|nr:hypothetical protein [Flavobacterium agrisoli]MBK0369809.1 hypothetical protein [Flavobacterium agrisoli]
MKIKLLLVFGFVVSALFATPNFEENTKKTSLTVETNYDCNYSQCQATAKSTGKQCKHCVSKDGDLYCWQHKK